ncbi:MAG: ArsR family transcriptional regulator [Candidatus Methanoperedens sp.]|jgi:DNA-binding MarR family transcriptional regulator|nr:ArsR family transcriptional regulator [Candidatus Methanoperedens sp.]PKL52708.1 MAG: ArsR family transcriptional regulator [Candidatus Methanoperedenaceae archaeon HGW-Methanoperedenaceae-1]
MPNPTTFAIFKELKEQKSISDIAGMLGLNHSTISTAVSSLIEEGLAQKQRDGKKVFAARAITLHARSLAEFLNEYPRLQSEDIFSSSSLEVLSAITQLHNITDIAAMTGLNRHTVSTALLKLSRYGIVLKEKRRFVLNKRHRQIAGFVSNYWRYIANQRLQDIAVDAVILWQRGHEFLFKTQTAPEYNSESNIQPTATTVFFEYNLRTITTTRYYFYTRRKLSVEDHVIHMILIDPQNPIYNSYAAAFIMHSGTKDLLTTGRLYDMEDHVKSLLEYIDTKEKNSTFVLPWDEYMDLFDSLVVN